MDSENELPEKSEDPDEIVISTCTPTNCVQDEDKYKLECVKCKRLVHYRCTLLPKYQIQMFLISGYRKFV